MQIKHPTFKRIWAMILLVVMVFGLIAPGMATTAYAAGGKSCMTFRFNDVQYEILLGGSGGDSNLSYSADADGNFKIRFLRSGTFTILRGNVTESSVTVIGGGGGGDSGWGAPQFPEGNAGGGNGGGGGQENNASISLATNTPYNVVIGAGGAGGFPYPGFTALQRSHTQGKGQNGQPSSFGSITAAGGVGGAGGSGGQKTGGGQDGTGRNGGGGAVVSTFAETNTGNFKPGQFSCFVCGTDSGEYYPVGGWDPNPDLNEASACFDFFIRDKLGKGAGLGGPLGGGKGGEPNNEHGCRGTQHGANGLANTGGGGGGGAYASRVYQLQVPPCSSTGSGEPAGWAGYGGNGGSGMVELTGNSIGASGSISLNKSSRDPALTSSSPCYSLEGAVYSLYATEADAQNGSSPVASLTTDAQGHATAADIPVGSYFMKETKAPKGFSLDPTIYPVTINENQNTAIDVQDEPLLDPVVVVLRKVDSNTNQDVASGNMSLAGAEFTVQFYSGFYDSPEAAEASGAPTRSWVLKTDERGATTFDPAYLVSGDEFYLDKQGVASFPLGTVVIFESKAPEGYHIDTTKHLVPVREDALESGGSIAVYNEPTIPERPFMGGVSVIKRDAEQGDEPQSTASFAGGVFSIINDNDVNVTVGGVSYAKGEVVATMTTDDTGYAATAPDLLPYGNYIIRETIAPQGYTVNTQWSAKATISQDGQMIDLGVCQDALVRGGISVVKRDSELPGDKHHMPQGTASLAGAEFSIYNNTGVDILVGGIRYAQGDLVTTIVTDESGYAATAADLLPYGSYTVKETKAPQGYTLNESWSAEVTVIDDAVIVAAGEGMDTPIKGGISVLKRDGELPEGDNASPQGTASFAGAEFAIINDGPGNVVVDGQTYAVGEQVATITTDKSGMASTASDMLPYGRYSVKEIKAPQGYTLNESWKAIVDITEANTIVSAGVCGDIPVKGGVEISKVDKDTGTNVGVGGTTLLGAEISIYSNNTNPIAVNGKAVSKGGLVATMTTDDQGHATTGPDALPVGSYTLRETKAPMGYEINEAWEGSVTITEADAGTVKAGDNGNTLEDELIRSDVHFNKAHGRSLKRLPGIVFKVTSKATGEWHLIVTDSSGRFDSAIAPHSKDTNINDAALLPDGTLDESRLVIPKTEKDWYGVWFYGSKDIAPGAAPADGAGAFPYGTYTFEELRSSANEGLDLLKFDYDLILKGVNEDMGTLLDHPTTGIDTKLVDSATGLNVVAPGEDIILKDTVNYSNLDADKSYTMVGTLMDKDSGKPFMVNGVAVETRQEFHPKLDHGSLEMTFRFDGSDISGKTLVAFEKLLDASGEVVAKHEDLNDADQTVYVPVLDTTARGENDDKEVLAGSKTVIVDEIHYANLLPDITYTLRSTLIDKATGEVARADNGDKLEIQSKFKPSSPAGTVQVTFNFEGSKLAGKTLVVFETIEYRGAEVAVHKDIDDAAQTVTLPKIDTTLTAANGSHFTSGTGEIVLTDTVTYENLTVGRRYTLTGTLMNKLTGEALKDADGSDVTASTSFTAQSVNGTAEVSFTFDSSILAGGSVVAFEELRNDFGIVAEHKDINDEDQTVGFPRIKTTATDKNGDKLIPFGSDATLIDIVEYSDLEPGTKYTLRGSLVDKDSGDPILDSNGDPIVVKESFTAKTSSGEKRLRFTVPASSLPENAIVVFETLYTGNTDDDANIVAVHEDLGDEDQTVYVLQIDTVAADAEGNKLIPSASGVTVVDTISYNSLLVGETYRINGSLIDKATGKPVKAGNGDPVVTTTEVTIDGTGKTAYGTVEMRFELDSSALAGHSLVVFEEVIDVATDRVVGSHKDINDSDQTVFIPDVRTTLLNDASNSHEAMAGENIALTDTVEYTGLIVGKEYTVVGTLIDKSSGKAIMDESGKAATVSKTFIAEKSDGSVEVRFSLDASLLSGKSVVAFESISYEGKEVAAHKDLNDEDQTVHFPWIDTTATDKNGEKEIEAVGSVTIVDVVEYKNLIPGNSYTLHGVLMDKASNSPIVDAEGKEITVTKTFKPNTADGTVEMNFTLDASGKDKISAVVFESLYAGEAIVDAKLIAEHKDINDEGQTVMFKQSGKLLKVDATSEQPLSGVKIRIKDLTLGTSYEALTDDTGTVYFPLIAGHKYSYQEIEALPGYMLDSTVYEFTVDEHDIPNDDLILRNIRQGTVILTKTDVISGVPVKGAEITVYGKDGKPIFTQLTDKFGRIYFDPGTLSPGTYTYTYRETKAPDGYYLNTDVYSFTIDANGIVKGTTKFTDVPYGTIVIKKVDTNGAPLKGAILSIYNSDGRKLGTGKSNDTGRVYFIAPTVGNYYFVEDKAPQGYIKSNDKFYFSINGDGVISGTTTIVNKQDPSGGSGGPKTGDNSQLGTLIPVAAAALIVAAGCGYGAVMIQRRKKRDSSTQN